MVDSVSEAQKFMWGRANESLAMVWTVYGLIAVIALAQLVFLSEGVGWVLSGVVAGVCLWLRYVIFTQSHVFRCDWQRKKIVYDPHYLHPLCQDIKNQYFRQTIRLEQKAIKTWESISLQASIALIPATIAIAISTYTNGIDDEVAAVGVFVNLLSLSVYTKVHAHMATEAVEKFTTLNKKCV